MYVIYYLWMTTHTKSIDIYIDNYIDTIDYIDNIDN